MAGLVMGGGGRAAVLTAERLGCYRGDRWVFAGIDFALQAGDALVLRGPNGAGKSSLLRQLAGLLPAHDGRLRWDGTPIGEDPVAHARRVRFIGHADAIKPAFTVRENLVFWAHLQGRTDRIGTALSALSLEGLADLPARLLSAGQRRRLALARVMLGPAPLWLLDEPSVALDSHSIDALMTAIGSHRAGGGMVVVATHDAIRLENAAVLTLDHAPPARTEPR